MERKREGFEELGSRAPDMFVCARIRGWRAFFAALEGHVRFHGDTSQIPFHRVTPLERKETGEVQHFELD